MPNGLLVWFSLLLIELGLAKILGPHDYGGTVRQPTLHMPLYGPGHRRRWIAATVPPSVLRQAKACSIMKPACATPRLLRASSTKGALRASLTAPSKAIPMPNMVAAPWVPVPPDHCGNPCVQRCCGSCTATAHASYDNCMASAASKAWQECMPGCMHNCRA